jgi:hypothetical protein
VTAFLILTGLGAAWVLSLLVHPFGRCWLCRGGRVRTRGRRARRCWACKGAGRRQRLGSRTIHRIRRQVAAHWRDPRVDRNRHGKETA